jgi:D-glycero-D-manno-heptose 1,7-bisphosphate phosphatase
MNSAIFIDKDGTLIKDVPYNADPNLVSLETNMVKGLKMLAKVGFKLFLVSNQSGIALGYFDYPQLLEMESRLDALLMEQGVKLDGYYYCPHHPNGIIAEYSISCTCRKPLPGLLQAAAAAHQIDLSTSWMIGDILDDVEAGNIAGCKTVLINNGNETKWLKGENRRPTFIAPNINIAATFMLEHAVSTCSPPLTQLQ